MPQDDLEIARRLLSGWSPQLRRQPTEPSLLPAPFREIDGRELARQYVTHRKITVAGRPGPTGLPPEPGSRLAAWARDLHARMTRS